MIKVINTFEYGDNTHIIYHADAAGDVLAPGLHDHTWDHLCVPMSGKIEVFFDDREPIEMVPGESPVQFPALRMHGIRALTDGAVFMGIQKTP